MVPMNLAPCTPWQQITSGTYEFHSPQWDAISTESKAFISDCLTVEIEKRPTAITLMEVRGDKIR